MSKPFAKLFETERGQVLVYLHEGEDGPELVAMADLGTPFSVSSVRLHLTDSDEARVRAEENLAGMTTDHATALVAPMFAMADEARASAEQS